MREFKLKRISNEVREVRVDGHFIKMIDLSQDTLGQWTDECVAQGDSEKDTVNQWIGLEANEIGQLVCLKRHEHNYLVRQLIHECSGAIEREYQASKNK